MEAPWPSGFACCFHIPTCFPYRVPPVALLSCTARHDVSAMGPEVHEHSHIYTDPKEPQVSIQAGQDLTETYPPQRIARDGIEPKQLILVSYKCEDRWKIILGRDLAP